MNARCALVVAVVLAAQPALAHEIIPGVGGFPGGLLHPLLIPTHLLALLSLALLIARQPASRWMSELTFVVALIGGLGALTFGVGETPAPLVLLGVSVVCGLLIAAALPLPGPIVWPMAVATGVAVGLDSPPDVLSIRMAYVIMFGTWLGAVLVLVTVTEGAARLKRPWQEIGRRVLGSWIAASAILVLALRLAR